MFIQEKHSSSCRQAVLSDLQQLARSVCNLSLFVLPTSKRISFLLYRRNYMAKLYFSKAKLSGFEVIKATAIVVLCFA